MTETSGATNKADYTFGQIAIRDNICTFEQVKECLDIQAKLRSLGIEPKKLGEILIEKGYLTPDQAVQLAKSQMSGLSQSGKLSIPGYDLISRIGQGAMGTVYKAKQVSMDRVVAIKILSSRYSKDRTFVERFLREARAVAKLNHENIITGIDVGEANGHHYFVMEYVDGAPVTGLMKRDGRLDEQRCLRIGVQVARALAHAHKHGIVHRDIKPENIMLTATGAAKLCDLGLAKQTKGDADVTMDGTSVGTPNYISPEQARGEEKIDIRSDIYSLGASLYHMAVGAPPFSGANPMVVMTKHVTEFPEPPKRRCPALSEGFSSLVMRMMQKRREDRPQDPDSLIHDMEKLLNGEPLPRPAAERHPTSTPRSATHHTHTSRSHVSASSSVIPAAKSSSSAAVVAAVAGVVAIVGTIVYFSRGDDPPPAPKANPNLRPAVVNSSGALDPEEKAKRDVQRFWELVDSQIGDTAKSDRFTEPYGQILRKIERSKAAGDFAAQRIWSGELAHYTAKMNGLITSRIWTPIKARADIPFNSNNYAKAQEELSKLEDVYKYFRTGEGEVKTQAGREQQEYLEKLRNRQNEEYLDSKLQADKAFKEPAQRDEAYRILDGAVVSATPEQREEIERGRLRYLQQDVNEVLQAGGPEAVKKALDRIGWLRSYHSKNIGATGVLDELARKIRSEAQQASEVAVSQAMSVYSGTFRPAFDEALRRRDLESARKSLYALYFSTPPQLQTQFLPASTDTATLRAFLEPSRSGIGDARRVVGLAEEGIRFTALRASQYEAARELYVDLRITALLEEFLEEAVLGAAPASREPGRFRNGFSPVLKDASGAEPAPRKPGEGPSILVTVGSARSVVPLAPAGRQSLPEDDIVALARRAPGAASDPQFALKAFYLYLFADRLREAKDWLDRIPSAEGRIGTERYVDRFKGMTSAREEEEVKRAFAEAWDLYYRKKDSALGAKRFRELLDRYSGTEYMKVKVPPNNRSRLDIVQDLFGGVEGKPKGLRSGLRELFAGAEVRDLGRGRCEVSYSGFKEERDLSYFAVADGQVTLTRQPGGLALQGTGLVHWNVPLKGDVSLEVSYRPTGEGAFGLALHTDGNRSGYLAVPELPIPNVPPLNAIFRLPVGQGAQVLSALVAQGGAGLQVQKNAANLATFTREGAKLKFTLGRGELLGENPQFNEGRVGMEVINQTVLIDRVRITGEIEPAWLDSELKRLERK